MTIQKFIDNVIDAKWAWAEGEYEGKAGYFVKAPDREIFTESEGFQPACIHVTKEGIEKNSWTAIKATLPDLTYVSRVVGYFSKINNWNMSKRGELMDRHAGIYAIKN